MDATALLEQSDKGAVELTGEIVDSKCFLGVMVPGSGKTHKECASLCLRGGIPPALFVQDRAGHSSLLLLVGQLGSRLVRERFKSPVKRSPSLGRFSDEEVGWCYERIQPSGVVLTDERRDDSESSASNER